MEGTKKTNLALRFPHKYCLRINWSMGGFRKKTAHARQRPSFLGVSKHRGDRAMHTAAIATKPCHVVCRSCTPRWCALQDVAVSAVNGKALSRVALAGGTPRITSARHRVKCTAVADGLAAASHLIDWSSLTADRQWQWLRACMACDGRSITRCEEGPFIECQAPVLEKFSHPRSFPV